MSDLETKLRQLAKNGELTNISMHPVAGIGEYGCVFSAQISPASRFGHSDGRDADPVKALLKAIDGLPKAIMNEKRARLAKQFGDPTDEPAASALDELLQPWDITS